MSFGRNLAWMIIGPKALPSSHTFILLFFLRQEILIPSCPWEEIRVWGGRPARLPYVANKASHRNPFVVAPSAQAPSFPADDYCYASAMAPKKKEEKPAAKAPKSGGGGKQKKKKWSKGKQKEKVNNMVLFDQGTYDKLLVEVPKYKLITPSVLSDRLRITGSLARRAIKELMAKGTIRLVAAHANQQIYTRATNT